MANELFADLPLTSFPQNIDSFTTWLNVTAQDGPLIQQYITAMNAGNQAQANQILTQISSGSQKIIKATDLNKLTQAILAVERFYSTDIKPYVQNKQEEWLNIINQFSYVGTWSNDTAYVQNNIVSYIVSGVTLLFIATSNPPTGTVPTNTQYWRPLSVQGTAGESGPGLSYRQEWNSSTSYSVNDCVTYNGAVWMALQANKNIIPGQNESYWKNIISFGVAAYPIQDTEPTGQATGGLWFNTQDNPTNYVYLEPLNNPAGADQILQGYEAYDGQGNELTGTIPSKQAQTYTPGTAPQTINANQYLSGVQTIEGDPDLVGGNILSGVDIFGVAGTIPKKSAQTYTPTTTDQTITSGQYLDGAQTIKGDANLVPNNILSGISIFGVEGNAQVNNAYYARGTTGEIHDFTIPFIPTGVMMCTGNYFMGTGKGIISAFKLPNGTTGGVGARISSDNIILDDVSVSWGINSTDPQNVRITIYTHANAGGTGFYTWYTNPFVVFWN